MDWLALLRDCALNGLIGSVGATVAFVLYAAARHYLNF